MTTQTPLPRGMAVFGIILMLAGALLLGLAYLSSQARPSEGEEASARLEEAIANTSGTPIV